MTMQDKEIIEKFWTEWESLGESNRYDVRNKTFVEDGILFGLRKGKELGKQQRDYVITKYFGKSFIKNLDKNFEEYIELTKKFKQNERLEGRKQLAEETIKEIIKMLNKKISREERL